jgi:Fe(3+) dicitrate transport protein
MNLLLSISINLLLSLSILLPDYNHIPISNTNTVIINPATSEVYSTSIEILASSSDTDTLKTGTMPQIEVIGVMDRFVRIPGSAELISFRQIQILAPVSGHEVFRRVTGLHAVEEEGIGLRANIGIRGLDPDKSRTVLMMEDGIPIALAPYGEPEMYYTPSMDRMVGVEVLKGSGSILFGPQTFGGVINYVTANPPPVPTTSAHIRGGEGGYFVGRFGYGTTYGNTGFQATYLRKQGDKVGLLNYGINDFNSKIKMVLASNSIVGIKLGFYDEQSNSTYIGLTQTMYDSGNFDFTHLSPDDNLSIRRYSGSVTHDYYFSDEIRLKSTVYGYTTTRNWSREDFDNVFSPTRTYNRIVGDTSVPFGAIYFRNTTGNRNRQFEVLGAESRLSVDYFAMEKRNEMDFGVRYLYERAFEQRIDGTPAQPTSGILRDDEIRTGRAISVYLQNRVFLSDALTVTPGVRIEHFEYERDIFRVNSVETDIKNSDVLTEVIPGIGFNYKFSETGSFFGGVHRGFGPPRTKDAITAAGVTEDLNAEKSWNFELGMRSAITNYLDVDFTAFFMNFSNQVIPVSESSGGVGQGLSGLINGGETEHLGAEASFSLNIGKLLESSTEIGLRTAATYTQATFSNDRFINSGGNAVNVKGNTLPYAPEFMLNTRVDILTTFGLGFGADVTYLGRQYGDPLNTKAGSANGRTGEIPAYTVINAGLTYAIPTYQSATFSVSIKNLLDERYIVSRRPQGIRAGLPRFVSAGVDLKF